jgi:hypothetical protein
VDEFLTESREAERKAAELDHLGWGVGAGATVWARAAQDVLALHESARERFATNTAGLEAWERFHGSALMVIVAVAQVLAFEYRVRRLTGDAELQKARARFDAVCPGAEDLRDMVAHLEDYAVGKGLRQQPTPQGTPPPVTEKHLAVAPFWTDEGGTHIDLGDKRVELRVATKAAAELAQIVERVRAKYLAKASKEANDAMWRRYEHYKSLAEQDHNKHED